MYAVMERCSVGVVLGAAGLGWIWDQLRAVHGVLVMCGMMRYTQAHKKGECGARDAGFGCAGRGVARAGAGGVTFAGWARAGRVHAAEGALDAAGSRSDLLFGHVDFFAVISTVESVGSRRLSPDSAGQAHSGRAPHSQSPHSASAEATKAHVP